MKPIMLGAVLVGSRSAPYQERPAPRSHGCATGAAQQASGSLGASPWSGARFTPYGDRSTIRWSGPGWDEMGGVPTLGLPALASYGLVLALPLEVVVRRANT